MKKKLLLPLFTLILALYFSFGFTNSVAAATNDDFKEELSNLTKKEVVSNIQRIDQEYEIGEAFSEKDQAFIQMYAKPVNDGMFSIAISKYSGF